MSSSWTITDSDSTVDVEPGPPLPPVRPGEFLQRVYMDELSLSAEDVALAMGVQTQRVRDLLEGRRSITGEDAMRLGHAFRNGDVFWMNVQTRFELETARRALADHELDSLPTLVAA